MEQTTQNFSATKNEGVRHGVVLGIAGVIIYMLCYVIDFKLLFSTWVGFGNIILIIAATILAVRAQRKAQGGYIEFGEAVLVSLATIVVSSIITVAFTYILYNFIDADLAQKGKEVIVANTEEMMVKFGAPQSQIDVQLETLEQQDFSQTPLSALKALAITTAMGLVYSLVLGIIMRHRRPMFAH
jgi:hypothetical protein